MRNVQHFLLDLESEITRLKNKNRNYKQACKHLTKAYDTLRLENLSLKAQLSSYSPAQTTTEAALKIAA